MKTIRTSLAESIILFILVTASAHAQVYQTFVSHDGKDANPCDTPEKPCRTIGGALMKTHAGGAVVVMDSATYDVFTVTKAITVSAPNRAAIAASSGSAVTVSAGPDDAVVLRGLTLRAGSSVDGNGIQFSSAATLTVESCLIEGRFGNGIRFDGGARHLFVRDTTVRGIAISAIFVGALDGSRTMNATIEHCWLEGNGGGIFATDNARVTVRNSVASQNPQSGFLAYTFREGVRAELNLEDCLATANGWGITAGGYAGTALVRVSNTSVTNNSGGVDAAPGVGMILSRGNNTLEGNGVEGSFSGTFPTK